MKNLDQKKTWLAPAKINLFLHITARRPDGYHQLQTLFQLLSVGDQMQFEPNRSGQIKRISDVPGVPESADIIVKAARLLQNHCGCRNMGADIHINKILPMGGGLGGGSSDAATTLVALNHLWGQKCPQSELLQLAIQLGADVPVFVAGRSAWAEGIGEQLSAVELPDKWYVIVTPRVEIATVALFNDPQLTRDRQAIRIRDYFAGRDAQQSSKDCQNVFEPLVRKHYPVVATALDWLSEQSGQKARLSGTGASIFAEFKDEQAAQSVAEKVSSEWRCFVAQGINESPIIAQCNVSKD